MSKVRTTVIVEESLLDEVKKLAFERKQTVTEVINQTLRIFVRDAKKPNDQFSDIPAHGKGGQLIDLEDKELVARLEAEGKW
jgi:hypothetical protein